MSSLDIAGVIISEISETVYAFADDFDPAQIDENGDTLLMRSCVKGLVTFACTLIDKFGDRCLPSHISNLHYTALILASKHKHLQIVNKIIDAFEDKCLPDYGGENEKEPPTNTSTALIWSCAKDAQIALTLIDKFGEKCNPGQTNIYLSTALWWACHTGKLNVVKKLIEKFGDKCLPGQATRLGNTALLIAYRNKNFTIAHALIQAFGEKCKPSHINNVGDTALMWACCYESIFAVSELIDTFGDKCLPGNVNNSGITVLLCASLRSEKISLKFLETFGTKLNLGQADASGKTALDNFITNKFYQAVDKFFELTHSFKNSQEFYRQKEEIQISIDQKKKELKEEEAKLAELEKQQLQIYQIHKPVSNFLATYADSEHIELFKQILTFFL